MEEKDRLQRPDIFFTKRKRKKKATTKKNVPLKTIIFSLTCTKWWLTGLSGDKWHMFMSKSHSPRPPFWRQPALRSPYLSSPLPLPLLPSPSPAQLAAFQSPPSSCLLPVPNCCVIWATCWACNTSRVDLGLSCLLDQFVSSCFVLFCYLFLFWWCRSHQGEVWWRWWCSLETPGQCQVRFTVTEDMNRVFCIEPGLTCRSQRCCIRDLQSYHPSYMVPYCWLVMYVQQMYRQYLWYVSTSTIQ